jgi:hypothetical protein
MSLEIGDSFKIIDTDAFKRNCKSPDEIFVVDRFSDSKLSVYYIDTRTKMKCRCNNCFQDVLGKPNMKCIGVYSIELVEKRIVRIRDEKLKELGI